MPDGDGASHLVSSRLVLQFTPDVSWSTLAQYDNVDNEVGINSRFRWIIAPGNELFIVFNQSFEGDEGDHLEPTFTEMASKLVWTFRL